MKASYLQGTHHIYQVIQVSRHDKFSRFYQIIFSNSVQVPKKEQALLQSPAFHLTLVSRSFCLFRRFCRAKQTQLTIHDEITTQPFMYLLRTIQRYIPGPHGSSVCIFENGGLTLCLMIIFMSSICHYSFP